MSRTKTSPHPLDRVWLVVVPQPDFTEPQFHFGERVQWAGENDQRVWQRQTGCIIGMTFIRSHGWLQNTLFIEFDQTLLWVKKCCQT